MVFRELLGAAFSAGVTGDGGGMNGWVPRGVPKRQRSGSPNRAERLQSGVLRRGFTENQFDRRVQSSGGTDEVSRTVFRKLLDD
jgi:hypothetical protein